MISRSRFFAYALALATAAISSPVAAVDADRGMNLHDAQCGGCHTDKV